MLTVRIIPCLDIKGGRVVKGVKFQNLKDAGSIPEQAKIYEEQEADELVLLDVSATIEERQTNYEIIKQLRKQLTIPLTVGGGVKNTEIASKLLNAGADKVGINTAAVVNPGILKELSGIFGSQCTILAIDAAQKIEGKGWEVVIESGRKRTGLDAVEWAKQAVDLGAGEILLTSWDRDGTKEGYDNGLISAISKVVDVPVIASGGAASAAHMVEAVNAGANAVLAASIFHYGEYTVPDLKKELKKAGVEVRL